LLNGLVLGQDSVQTVVYRGKIYWFWGDTNWPGQPLGNFQMSGATSLLPEDDGLDPEVGVELEYFLDEKGFSKPMANIPLASGPNTATWLDGFTVLKDDTEEERLFARYVKLPPLPEPPPPPELAPDDLFAEQGLAEFDDKEVQFKRLLKIDLDAPLFPSGHPFKHTSGGKKYVYFFLTRVRSTIKDFVDVSKYQTYSCFKKGSREDSIQFDRINGRLRYRWKTDTVPLTPDLERKLIDSGRMELEEGRCHMRDVATGKWVMIHTGSVFWNEHRERWILIATERKKVRGTEFLNLGRVWYSEADKPTGPWLHARKIVTHDNKYGFYNPTQHPMFDKHDGRVIFFEGTYSQKFSGHPDQTPRYDYNQIMYKLDLSDPRLNLTKPASQ
jgi:hypothetical protein